MVFLNSKSYADLFRSLGFRLGVVALGAVGLGWFFHQKVILPEVARRGAVESEIRAVEGQIQKTTLAMPGLEKPKRRLEIQAQKVERLRRKIAALDSRILGTDEVKLLLGGSPEGEAARPDKSSPYAREAFDLVALGPYDAIVQYLRSIEKSSPFLKVESIQMSRQEGGTNPEGLDAEITVGTIHSSEKTTSLKPAQGRTENFTFQGIQDPFVRS